MKYLSAILLTLLILTFSSCIWVSGGGDSEVSEDEVLQIEDRDNSPAFKSPTASSVWTAGGSAVSVSWYTGTWQGDVSIKLYKDTVLVSTLYSGSNTGSFDTWQPSASLTPGINYFLKMESLSGETGSIESEHFIVQAAGVSGSVTLLTVPGFFDNEYLVGSDGVKDDDGVAPDNSVPVQFDWTLGFADSVHIYLRSSVNSEQLTDIPINATALSHAVTGNPWGNLYLKKYHAYASDYRLIVIDSADESRFIVSDLFTIREDEYEFSWKGFNWVTRTTNGEGDGPGDPLNYWTSASDAVWIDDQDRLHLKAVKRADEWYCPEIHSKNFPAGQGSHIVFYVDSDYSVLDPNLVAGLFLYKDDTHELDIELTRWNGATETNSQFAVQPSSFSGHLYRFDTVFEEGSAFDRSWTSH